MGHFAVFGHIGGTENSKTTFKNTPLKPPFRHFGDQFEPPKSDFWPFHLFGHFLIEISIGAEKTTIMGRKGPREKQK